MSASGEERATLGVRSIDVDDQNVTPGRRLGFVKKRNRTEDATGPAGEHRIHNPVGGLRVPSESGEFRRRDCVESETSGEDLGLRGSVGFDPRFLEHYNIGLGLEENRFDRRMTRFPVANPSLKIPCHDSHGSILPDLRAADVFGAGDPEP